MSDESLPTSVLDTSALLALVHEEAGADRVERAIRQRALMGTINWAEVLSDLVEGGESVEQAVMRVQQLVMKVGTLDLVNMDEHQAEQAARLRPVTRSLGLSLADRACLALGRIHRLPVLTTDRAWRSLRISVKIEVIR